MSVIKRYYALTKPGIVRANVMAAVAGFLLASPGHIALVPLLALVVGVTSIIAGSCVTNNYLDRNIDARMKRTQGRALVTKDISVRSALIYALVLGIVGFASLIIYTNWLTAWLGAIGVVSYVIIYGYAKRTTRWGTLVGTISGAVPPVSGYTAATGRLDVAALLLFLLLVAWQMPHFYAIAIFRQKEYAAAGIPVWPIVKGLAGTRLQIIGYTLLFTALVPLLTLYGYTGLTYLVVMVAISLWWLRTILKKHSNTERWARTLFGQSLLVLMVLSCMLALGPRLP
jgi:protoheme IX farnesyltransferase